MLGTENGEKLKIHIKKLQMYSFTSTCECSGSMTFNLAENLGINHKLNKEKELARYDWLNMLLKRHFNVRKSENVPLYE